MTNKEKHIPQGYKDSPLGIIPEEWEVKRVKDVSSIKGRIGYRGYTIEDIVNDSDGAISLSPSNIVNGKLQYSPVTHITWEKYYESPEIMLYNGDIVMVKTGSSFGKVAFVDNLTEKATINPQFVILKDINVDNKWLCYLFDNDAIQKEVHKIVVGGAIPTMSQEEIANFQIAVPPIEEQQCIVSVLSLWDIAIEKQSELIEKLKLRKRALMQQLLTGKKRLPGFSGEWKEVKLGDVFDERNETNRDDLPLLSITGEKGVIYQSDSDKRDISNDDKTKYKRICPNDIGYNTMRMWQGRSALSELEGIVSPAYTIVTPRENVNVKFMAILIQQPRVVYDFWTHSQGLVSDTLNCKYPDFCQVKVRIPTKQEQTAIASVLVQADKEIELAKEQLANLQSQKRGLMQQLLTGKNRII